MLFLPIQCCFSLVSSDSKNQNGKTTNKAYLFEGGKMEQKKIELHDGTHRLNLLNLLEFLFLNWNGYNFRKWHIMFHPYCFKLKQQNWKRENSANIYRIHCVVSVPWQSSTRASKCTAFCRHYNHYILSSFHSMNMCSDCVTKTESAQPASAQVLWNVWRKQIRTKHRRNSRKR